MKNFEKITSNKETLATVVVNVAQGTAKDTIQTIRNSLETHDFTEPQYRYLSYLLDMIEARNDLQKESARRMYVEWLDREDSEPTENAVNAEERPLEERGASAEKDSCEKPVEEQA